ncbi:MULTISPECIES: long-chain fatty acid--CoA ligase [unclassified Nocardiopsis]|uniref:long-chain fatty acid--CoA ligase n=1 Tax=unclassified Nocardiopsis TaxID=2649073 RepID=UPI0034035396
MELLRADPGSEEVSDRPWRAAWSADAEANAALVARHLPAHVDHRTSGSGGDPVTWRRTAAQLWAEAGLLADLLRPHRPQAVLSFAPPRHVFGTLATLLVPARLGVPVWYRPRLTDANPPGGSLRWAVMAIPWTFSLLRPRSAWLGETADLTFLHSTARLPAAAADLVGALGPDRARVIEVLGSTETGGVASRRWEPEPPPWRLLDDTSFSWEGDDGRERRLEVASPRMAARPGRDAPDRWRMDDHVTRTGEREFVLTGRRERLVKVNGRRVCLDTVEERLRPALDCADLGAVPVTHDTIGEHYELYVVPRPGQDLTPAGVAAVAAELGPRPHRVRVVERVDRSPTGKTLRRQSAPPSSPSHPRLRSTHP